MPWLESRRRRKEAEEWRRENQRRLGEDPTDDRVEGAPVGPPPDGAPPGPTDGSGTDPQAPPPGHPGPPASPPRRADASPPPPAVRRERPDVPVDLGLVDDDEYTRAVRRVVARALAEDLATGVDLTSMTTVPVGTVGRAALVAREPGVVAGLDVVGEVVRQVDERITVTLFAEDGDRVDAGDVVARLEGPLRTLLTAERTLLNIVCQLSGVATHTAEFAKVLEGLDCVVRDTRKTTPGLRLLEKRAVEVGGGANHRIGLYDAILVKDNHVAAAGGVAAAARAALDGAPEGVHVQVEVTTMEEVDEALAEGVVDLLLDNFSPAGIADAVARIAGRAAVEASGGITLESARSYAEAGADRLAVGALTHSAPALDLALDVEQVGDDTEVEEAPEEDEDLVVDRAPYDDTPDGPGDSDGSSSASRGRG